MAKGGRFIGLLLVITMGNKLRKLRGAFINQAGNIRTEEGGRPATEEGGRPATEEGDQPVLRSGEQYKNMELTTDNATDKTEVNIIKHIADGDGSAAEKTPENKNLVMVSTGVGSGFVKCIFQSFTFRSE